MGQIQKGFALTIAICGILYLLFGLISTVCGWILASKIPDGFNFRTNNRFSSTSTTFGVYWWGGCALFVPGILGIVAACTRNVCAMVAFLVFNIIGMIVAIGCAVYVVLILVLWMPVSSAIDNGSCTSLLQSCHCVDLSSGLNAFTMNASCETMSSVQPLLLGITVGVALCGLVSFVSSYISCCSLCNTEQVYPGMVVVRQPPNMVIMANTQFNQVPQAPYHYNQQVHYEGQPPPYYQEHVTSYNNYPFNDKAVLIDNRPV